MAASTPVRLLRGTFGFPGDVISVFGRVGSVVAQAGDYTFGQLGGLPSTLAGYGITDAQALDADLTAIAALTTTAFGRGALTQASAAAFRTYIGVAAVVTPASYQGTPTNQTGTTSTIGVQAGVPGQITPAFSGRIHVTCCGMVKNSLSGSGATVQIRKSNAANQAHPANGDTLVGSAHGGIAQFIAASANQQVPFSVTAIITGLTVGATWWLDVALAAITSGTATVQQVAISAFEF
jgi:hypothetical protein